MTTTSLSLKPSELAQFLASAIKMRAPVLITSSPGIGKTSITEQAVEIAETDLVVAHPVVSDPTDFKGLPWADKSGEFAKFLPYGELRKILVAKRPTVMFIDDLGQAMPATQASLMQLILARQINGHKISDLVTFIAATNRRTDRAGVSGILEPVKSRFVSIVELRADLDEWCQWALQQGLPPELVAFLRFRPDLLSQFNPTADMTNSPCPRTWANAARILAMGLPKNVQHIAVSGAVGEGAAVELRSFLDIYKTLPTIDEVLAHPKDAVIPEKPSELYAIITGLGHRVTVSNFKHVAVYIERLFKAKKGEFSATLFYDCWRKEPRVMETKEGIRLASDKEMGELIQGARI